MTAASISRRRFVLAAAGVGLLGAAASERTIRIRASRFVYSPAEVTLRRGEPVVLELETTDVLMGFSLPDFNVREDIVPGKISRVRLVPDKTGSYIFVCDIFCGSGHEEMHGKLSVIA